MRATFFTIFCCFATLCCVACSSTPTQTVVVFTADEASTRRATTLQIEVRSDNGSPATCASGETCMLTVDLATNGFPVRMPLVPQNDDSTRRFIITGTLLDGNGAFSVIRSESGYLGDQKRELTLRFESACADVECGSPLTCSDGNCVSSCDTSIGCGDAGVDDAGVDDANVDADLDAQVDPDADSSVDAEVMEAGSDADLGIDADVGTDADANVPDMPVVPTRVSDGLVALYLFDEGAGSTVADEVGNNPLTVSGNTAWIAGALQFNAAGGIAMGASTTAITTACQASNALTVESWITPAKSLYEGPARVVSFSETSSLRNFSQMFGRFMTDANVLAFRLRVGSPSDFNGIPESARPAALQAGVLKHYVNTHDGVDRHYVNGVVVGASEARPGSYAEWDDTYSLCIGNECSSDRPFEGSVHLTAIYCRALTAAEIMRNFSAGSE